MRDSGTARKKDLTKKHHHDRVGHRHLSQRLRPLPFRPKGPLSAGTTRTAALLFLLLPPLLPLLLLLLLLHAGAATRRRRAPDVDLHPGRRRGVPRVHEVARDRIGGKALLRDPMGLRPARAPPKPL